jgi:hypothetical protein
MKKIIATSVFLAAALLAHGEAEASHPATAGAGASFNLSWIDHGNRSYGQHRDRSRHGHRGHNRSQREYGHHYRRHGHATRHTNVALWQRQYQPRRAVNGYAALSQRRPCEWVRIERLDMYDQPMAVEFKRCFTAAGHGFEVPGSRVVLR